MIFTDGVHMISDVADYELHNFAHGIGLKRHFFHNRRGRNRPHYDLTNDRILDVALKHGAKSVAPIDLMKIIREVNK